ncbi:hypothetical protein ACFSTE_18715 [Aquimarina hainanensis]|uniref:Uncharacterized protein n=1 Tax=Aquimarina hainanensis TaxID=1578017 RepID=A0ABW5NBC8_9FLAO|nr:hypothetical protein [Aquimarina sp. TRL1]QKX06639.1 hypothetical protein HN014_17535 [Aquimarina sp. TRL1]
MPRYSNHDIEKKYSKLSTEELKTIVTENSREYRPTVLHIIIQILKNRGEHIDVSTIKYGDESTIKHDAEQSKSNATSVLLLGILFLVISIALSILVIALEIDFLSIFNVFIKIIISIISMKTAYDYAKHLNRKKYLWAFLGILVGGLALIILSFLKKKKVLTPEEKIQSQKRTYRAILILIAVLVVSILGFSLVNDYLDKKREADSYQRYIDRRIEYIENPKRGYLFYFTCKEYYQNITAKVIQHTNDSILFKSPRYLDKEHRELYRINGFNLEDSYYLTTWVTKKKLISAVESAPSDSGNFEGISFEEFSGTDMKYRFDRLE